MDKVKQTRLCKIGILLFYWLLSLLLTYAYFKHHCIFDGEDFQFHFARLYELIQTKIGAFPIISTLTFGQTGNQVQVFYPNQLLYPLAMIIKVTHRPILMIYLYLLLIDFLTFISCHWAAAKIGKSPLFCLTFAIIYTSSFYHLVNMYMRFDLGEMWAAVFLPLTLVGFYLVIHQHGGRLMLFVGLIGLLFSHLLTLALVGGILFIWFVVYIGLNTDRYKIIKHLLQVGIAVLGCGSIFLLPFAAHYLIVPTGLQATQIAPLYLKPTIWTKQWWALTHNVIFAEHGNYTAGILIIVLLIMTTLGFCYFHQKVTFNNWIILLGSWLALMLTTNLFPWKWFSGTFVNIIQFPFRFNTFVTLGVAWCVAELLTMIKWRIVRIWSFLLVSSMSLILAVNAIHQFVAAAPRGNHPLSTQTYSSYIDNHSANDYFPKQASSDIGELPWRPAYINGRKVFLNCDSMNNGVTYHISTNKKYNRFDLPFLCYSQHYHVTNWGRPIAYQFSHRGTFAIKTKTKNNLIHIQYCPTLIDRFSWVLSAIAFSGLGLIILWNKYYR
ncbi:MAG: hypothetical protein J6584_01095 [Lactobacillus sp.]|uniref:hypothetical protein n=1 Tax=Bombilactobacillus bombi TaxID=1303590 RepID=UPI0035EF4EC9|nr:hypothetical protein [Lactobacillus sp.]